MGSRFLNADSIRAATFVKHVEIHETLGSTNDRAAELAREAAIELPALVAGRHQTAGRGRGSNSWWSADGSLTFTVLLRPATLQVQTKSWPQLSLATAVAVCDALQPELDAPGNPQLEMRRSQSARRLGIKWPNDVVLDEGKICGILIESAGGAAPMKDSLAIGVGVNVNNSWQTAPSCAALHGIALIDVTGAHHELERILISILQAMEERFHQLGRGDPMLPSAWRHHCTLRGRTVCIDAGSQRTEGKCQGIAEDGALTIETATGLRAVYSGTVTTLA
jgi:BirA family biotin operon repressor/biotin-[acetyl-CoA-carboxylase] ligase